MHKKLPSFEWRPGDDIQDELDEQPEHILCIANRILLSYRYCIKSSYIKSKEAVFAQSTYTPFK